MKVPFFGFPTHKDGDVIVAAGNKQRKEVIDVDTDFYTSIGLAVVWCVKYIFIPFGVTLSAKVVAGKLFRSQPEGQRKKRL